MEKKWLNVKQASEYLDLSVNTIYKYVNQGKIKYYKSGKLRFLKSDLDSYVELGKVQTENEQIRNLIRDKYRKYHHL